MVTDLEEIRRIAERKEAENVHFRRYLKAHHCPEEPFHVIASEVEKAIDCTQCANCCRHGAVTVTDADIEAVAAYLNIPASEVVRLHTAPDPAEPGQRILINTGNACTFLDGSLCVIYDARPRSCREFPYASHRERSLGGRMESLGKWVPLCPIVFNSMERYKELIGYKGPE